MKKRLVFWGNVLIVLSILIFVILYAGEERNRVFTSRIEAFENMTVAMDHVTTNYLTGEQQVCTSWANYINASNMTIQEAADFVSASVTSPEIMGHLIFTDDGELCGLSTQPASGKENPYAVSYKNISIFSKGFDELLGSEKTVNVTRAYTNPVNAVQSIAFCQAITLLDDQTRMHRPAVLLKIIPASTFTKKWVFPTDDFENAEIALIDAEGDYIIKGSSFKNSNFFEFFKSYNESSQAELESLKSTVAGVPGTITLNNSRHERCLAAHTRVNSTDDWTIVTMICLDELEQIRMHWLLVGTVSAGLILLLLFNLAFMLRLNRRLKTTAAAADRANQAKTEFLSTMSHDIRTPMNAIIGLTTIASRNVDDMDTVKDCLRKISLAGNHLLTLINDILDISKVESGKLNLNPVTFSVVECADNLVNISQPMVKEKNIDFNFRINHFEHEYLYADQLRINQIFINILSNAIKYTQPGGRVCVDLRQSPGKSDSSVCLTYVVADTGIGMTPEYMERMYQPFSRQTDSRVNSIQGTGLGLAITKQMVDLMNGTIDCSSTPGEGTTFTITLDIPIADRPESEMQLPPIRVLIADDDEVLLRTASETLRSIGAEVDTAENGTQAVELATLKDETHDPYQVVILDLKMPDLDGIEAARQIHAQLGDKVSILLISAYDWSDVEDTARDAGINGFISKPLFRSTLYHKISEMLGSQTQQTDRQEDNTDIAGMHILVAEDNDINWEIISVLLKMNDIESTRANNGREALETISSAKPGMYDLIFMDIQMPEMNGIEATKAIRALQDPWARSIPIIAMTADAFSENVVECLAAGMNGHIAKPIDMKVVLKEIRRIKEDSKL